MGQILISRGSKKRRVEVSQKTHNLMYALKVFFPPDTPVKLGKYTFKISEIEPWPPPEQEKLR